MFIPKNIHITISVKKIIGNFALELTDKVHQQLQANGNDSKLITFKPIDGYQSTKVDIE